jgi:hypothetical protein
VSSELILDQYMDPHYKIIGWPGMPSERLLKLTTIISQTKCDLASRVPLQMNAEIGDTLKGYCWFDTTPIMFEFGLTEYTYSGESKTHRILYNIL